LSKRVGWTVQLSVHQLALGRARLGAVDLALDGDYQRSGARAQLEAKIGGARFLTARASSSLGTSTLREAPITVEAEIPGFDLSGLPDLAGTVDGQLELHGTLGRPLGRAELRARSLSFREQRYALVSVDGAWDGNVLTAKLDADQRPGALHLEARVPAQAHAPLFVSLSAHAFKIALARLGGLRKLAGTLDADLRAEGPRAQARVSGSLKLDDGSLGLAATPRLYKNLSVDIAARDGLIQLRQLAVAAGDGTLTAHGSARVEGLHPQSIDLAADVARFPIMARNLGAWIDAAVELHGERVGDHLTGVLTVRRGKARLPELIRRGRKLQPLGPLEDVYFSDEPERGPTIPRLDAEVIAHIPGPFQVRSRDVDADLRGQLDVLISDGKPRLHGHAETTWGRIELFGRRYEIEHARADFDGKAQLNPAIQVRLTREVSGTIIIVEVHGTAKKPELVLASDPPTYDSSQIIGILVSGDPANPGLADNRRGLLAATQGTVAGAVSNLFVHRITEQLMPGLPFEVHVESGQAARLELGHQLTDRIYLRYTHQFGATGGGIHQVNASEASVRVRLPRRASLTVRYGDAGVGVIDVSWTLRF
jgi:autotransporter translocation and assembly factor TamB